MKKINLILLLALVMLACKSESKTETVNLEENRAKSYNQEDGLITISGKFFYDEVKNAAIIQKNNNTVYGVVVDDNMKLLNEQVKPLKINTYDMVPVTVRVKRFEKPENEEGWPYRVEIKDILKIEKPSTEEEDVIKIGTE
ncbi:hypothetical protein RM697_08025 [Ichthyenterobacterium sp. W332]|uniref:Lipoprotein n=1 Tax=Microcosmobacter mediterraneus TaxID=3075607 RepID=A0ABU2YK94_9FLAO|nr:hypothetical protein [Ichthyenterobacterium sp. W332]MDT0558589.1 hypothetical protein [Ichthyenterobacterium sp. W332]